MGDFADRLAAYGSWAASPRDALALPRPGASLLHDLTDATLQAAFNAGYDAGAAARLHQAAGRCWCGGTHSMGEAIGMNRKIKEDTGSGRD